MVVRTPLRNEPVNPPDAEMSALRDAACALAGTTDEAASLTLADGTSVVVPPSVVATLRQAVQVMSENLAVAITPVDKRLTPHQAARMLNVGDEYFETLLTNGDIPFTTIGTLRFITLEDLLVYKRERDATRREALREMTRLSQEMGFYQPADSDPGTT